MARPLIILIKVYQYFSQFWRPVCRFHPTCSHYTVQALTKYGLFKGLWLSTKRILRCHPFHPGGYDPLE